MIRITNTQYVHFLEQADALRRSGLLCDAIISVRSQTFRAHRLVLACASRTLAEQLALGGGDGPVRCTLESFSPRTFKQVLDFAYTRALEVTREDLQLLLRAAEVLEMQPLEEQCRKQLESIHHKNSEAGEESGTQSEQKPRGGPHRDEKAGETVREACDSIVIEDISPSDPAKTPDSPQPLVKKARPPLSPAAPFDRVSVISRHTGGGASFSSPWIFPSAWKSVTTLRRLADYSGFIPFHPLQPPDQSTLPYAYASTTQHALPLLGSHLRSSDLSPAYARSLYTGSTGIESIIKQGLLKRKKTQERALHGSKSSYDEPESSTDPTDEHHQSGRCHYDEPGLRGRSSATSGESCGGSRGAVQQPSRQQEHKAGKQHQCQHCPKRFSLKHQLDTHHRVHTGEKPFECRVCGQRSRDYSAMIKHLRTHNGASPYRCTLCLEYCSSLVAMQRHVKNHAVQDFPPGWSITSTYLYNSHT